MGNNSTDAEYPSHVYWYFTDVGGLDDTDIVDKICGFILSFCLIFGSLANIFALIYFSKIKKKTLCEKFYTIISSLDLCTTIAQSPVMLSMWTQREPYLFNSRALCGVWIAVFEYLQRMSIYLIVLLSVTRTLAIVRPFIVIRERAVLMTLVPYSLLLLSDLIVGMSVKRFDQAFFYLFDYGYPIKGYTPKNANGTLTTDQFSYMKIQNWKHNLEVIVPSLIIFISFLIALGRLQTLPKATSSDIKIHRASVTMTIATAIFLTLNLPFFMILSALIYDDNTNSSDKILKKFPVVTAHMWPISKVVLVALNASVNPVLYICRISRFRRWLTSLALCQTVINFEETLTENRTEKEGSPLVLKMQRMVRGSKLTAVVAIQNGNRASDCKTRSNIFEEGNFPNRKVRVGDQTLKKPNVVRQISAPFIKRISVPTVS